MSRFPSELPFFSLLQYAPRGASATSQRSREILYAIKTNANRKYLEQTYNVISHAARRAAENVAASGILCTPFGRNVVLIPMPRSSLQRPGDLWPSLVICEALKAEGLCGEVTPFLRRIKPVAKAATAGPGQRPGPSDHDDSLSVDQNCILMPESITVVDDVITRGSSFVGAYPRLRSAFPGIPIHCFALVRTISGRDIDGILDPVAGLITHENGQRLHREP